MTVRKTLKTIALGYSEIEFTIVREYLKEREEITHLKMSQYIKGLIKDDMKKHSANIEIVRRRA